MHGPGGTDRRRRRGKHRGKAETGQWQPEDEGASLSLRRRQSFSTKLRAHVSSTFIQLTPSCSGVPSRYQNLRLGNNRACIIGGRGGRGGLPGVILGRSAGSVPGITLIVTVYDLRGQPLARQAGGIQLLAHIEDGKFVKVPREKLFADPAIMARAVGYATDSLPALVRHGLAP